VDTLPASRLLSGLNQALTVGSGTGQPTGIVTALAGGASVVNTGSSGVLAASDIYVVQNALGPRWQANARWLSNLVVANSIRQEETTNGALKFPSMQGNPPTLLGRPTHEASFMDITMRPVRIC
jgi:HK97 family phage major capsid protein